MSVRERCPACPIAVLASSAGPANASSGHDTSSAASIIFYRVIRVPRQV